MTELIMMTEGPFYAQVKMSNFNAFYESLELGTLYEAHWGSVKNRHFILPIIKNDDIVYLIVAVNPVSQSAISDIYSECKSKETSSTFSLAQEADIKFVAPQIRKYWEERVSDLKKQVEEEEDILTMIDGLISFHLEVGAVYTFGHSFRFIGYVVSNTEDGPELIATDYIYLQDEGRSIPSDYPTKGIFSKEAGFEFTKVSDEVRDEFIAHCKYEVSNNYAYLENQLNSASNLLTLLANKPN